MRNDILDVLSLDLDWFNSVAYNERRDFIDSFFAKLSSLCVVPGLIHIFRDHNYLYPWCLSLNSTAQFNIWNFDEHHDFYGLETIDFQNPNSRVNVGNFFAFMAHDMLINNYTWITNKDTLEGCNGLKSHLTQQLRSAKCEYVREIENRMQIHVMNDAISVLNSKTFHGFAIIRSPEYTEKAGSVSKWVRNKLQKYFPYHIVRDHRGHKNFAYKNMLMLA